MKRLEYLDSFRGMAAFSIVVLHCFLSFPHLRNLYYHEGEPDNLLLLLLTYSPLHIFWAGHEAVILFFVLSGFVLALPFLNLKYTSYRPYIIKRVCRIYLPYFAALVVSFILMNTLSAHGIASLSGWFNGMWREEITFKAAIFHLLMFDYQSHNINTVIWSLVHEMRISILFPLIMFIVVQYSWKKSLIIGVSSSLVLWIVLSTLSKEMGGEYSFLVNSFGDTFYFMSFFFLGATLAKYRNVMERQVRALPRSIFVLLLLAGIGLYLCEWILVPRIGELKFLSHNSSNTRFIYKTVTDFCIGVGVLLLLTSSIASIRFQQVLEKPALIWLGKISYSLYLTHPLVLLTLVYAFEGHIPLPFVIGSVPFVSILVAYCFYRVVEMPSALIGQRLSKKVAIKKEMY